MVFVSFRISRCFSDQDRVASNGQGTYPVAFEKFGLPLPYMVVR